MPTFPVIQSIVALPYAICWVELDAMFVTKAIFCFLRPDVSPQHCRQRRGSLESQTNLLSETASEKPVFTLSKSPRSSSTEILDDGSSYTSQSSAEYYVTSTPSPCYTTQTLDNRTRNRRWTKKQNISAANSGSMPNLAQKDVRNGGYPKSQEQPSVTCYIPGYAPYTECDVYYNSGYVYENGTEGQYTVNPSYRSSAHYGHERRYRDFRSFHEDEMERVPHNPYATLRLPRKPSVKSEHITKNIHKALVAEHLRGWYQRASGHKDQAHGLQAGFDADRGSQRSLGFAGLQVPCCPSSRASSFSSGNSPFCASAASRISWALELSNCSWVYEVYQHNQGPTDCNNLTHPYLN